MKTRILALTAATAAALGTTALAGSLEVTTVEPTPATPVEITPVAPKNEWTGAYTGLSFGSNRAENGGTDNTEAAYGLFGGYDYQWNNGLVTGAEIEYQGNDSQSVNGIDVDDVTRAKAKLGYGMGRTMVYTTAGMSKVNTSLGEASAPVYGIGAEYKVTERFGVGAEYLSEDFEDLGSTTTDLNSDTLNLRGTLRF